jgi:PKD repeat protein
MKIWRALAATVVLALGAPHAAPAAAQSGGACGPTNPDSWQACAPPPSCMTPGVFGYDTTQCMKDFAAACDANKNVAPGAGTFAGMFCSQMANFTYPPACAPAIAAMHPKACQTAAVTECKQFQGGGFPFQDQFCQTFFGTFPAPADGVPQPPPGTWPIDGPCNPIDPASWGSCAPPPSCFNPGGMNDPGACQRDFAAMCTLYSGAAGTFGGTMCAGMQAIEWPAACGFSSFLANQPACQAAMAEECKAFQGGGMPMQGEFCDTFFAGEVPTGPENTAPEATLSASPDSGMAPLNVVFAVGAEDADVGDSVTYDLDFGDGSTHATGTQSGNKNHTYTAAGSYTATLTVTDGSASDTATTTVTVTVQPNRAPAAVLAGPSTAALDTAVSFDGAASTDPDGDALSYTFDFGDGTVTAPGAANSAEHAYTGAGSYTVTLTVADGRGGTSSDTHTLTVANDEPPPTEVNAVLSSDKTGGEIPLTVNFNATGSSGPEGATLDYTFVFGDGTQSARQVTPWASHVYDAAGTYHAYVIVTDGGANSDVSDDVVIEATVTIVITPGQETEADLMANPTSGTVPLTVDFDASHSLPASGTTLASYRYDFGDGTTPWTGTAPTARHVYTEPGTYSAVVTVTDSEGATATDSVTIVVGAATTTNAQLRIVGAQSGTAPFQVTFDGSGSTAAPGKTITSWTFRFGDGTDPVTVTSAAAAAAVAHTYVTAGTYTPTLTVSDSSQTVSIAQAKVLVADAPEAADAGSGGGALGFSLLLPLAGLGLARRRRRH